MLLITTAFTSLSIAQSLEDFEDESVSSATFTNAGTTFNITSSENYDVFQLAGAGWNGTTTDSKFVDNSGNTTNGGGTGFTIKQSDDGVFYVIDLYLFCSQTDLDNHTGTLTITGRLNNSDVYTFSKSSGFADTELFTPNNGFTYIDFATEGSSDFTDDIIDELVVSSNGDLDYMALDAFQWEAATLPVNLKSFQADIQHELVALKWTTSQEINNESFKIQRSSDGRNFETIGSVEGRGTTYSESNYTFNDQNPKQQINYYRLKQIDFDGRFEYSEIVKVINSNSQTTFNAIYPNPNYENFVYLEYTTPINQEIEIKIISLNGSIISNSKHQISSDSKSIALNINAIPQGLYFIELTAGTTNKVFKLNRY